MGGCSLGMLEGREDPPSLMEIEVSVGLVSVSVVAAVLDCYEGKYCVGLDLWLLGYNMSALYEFADEGMVRIDCQCIGLLRVGHSLGSMICRSSPSVHFCTFRGEHVSLRGRERRL